jgi:hypothetical protein
MKPLGEKPMNEFARKPRKLFRLTTLHPIFGTPTDRPGVHDKGYTEFIRAVTELTVGQEAQGVIFDEPSPRDEYRYQNRKARRALRRRYVARKKGCTV